MNQQREEKPRLRLIAGPNGSGKTTLANYLMQEHPTISLGQYLNPDDIAKHIHLDLQSLNASCTPAQENDQRSKLAQQIAMGLRQDWVDCGRPFTYESVMSHAGHIEFVRSARQKGFRTSLYFVCTNAADLNVSRVAQRVDMGGHDVPEDKIRGRYARSLTNLRGMLEHCDRAYFFDNSRKLTFLGEMDAQTLILDEAAINREQPRWFLEAVLRKWESSRIRLV
ncbi:MAG: hypothetical protein CMI09_14545 [Oceanospirillaceae bacterium]|nr:hypothetical protein [Oceanospirillaceae bacterium]